MQNDTRFVVNIVPLQNVQINTSGVDATTALSNSVADMQKMVNFSQRTIYTDYLKSLTTEGSIGVFSPLALSNVGITSNGTAVSFGGSSSGSISTLSTATSFLTLGSGSVAALSVGAYGSTLFTVSTSGDATFRGACYAQQFLTLSDERVKTGLRPWRSPVLEEMSGIGTYVYSYIGSPAGQGLEIGLLAHEVKAAFPDCVGSSAAQGQVNSYIKYDSLVALLVKAVQELREEVRELRDSKVGTQS
jgi:hypothetical protein